jgi:hypothetical protein
MHGHSAWHLAWGCSLASRKDRFSTRRKRAGRRSKSSGADRKTATMTRFNIVCLKMVRWSGWPLLPVVFLFLLTGYIMDGRYGLSRLLDEKAALTFHRMLHLPLMILVLAHSVPAVYLALQRWGWIKHRPEP